MPLVCIAVEDHPHAYGDKFFMYFCASFCAGSSPRVWGQETVGKDKKMKNRIIPTRMGTSFLPILPDLLQRDHPHAYGDKLSITWCSLAVIGSSPRVWGQVIIESVK